MTEYRRSAHCVYDIKYHMVWITKYRKAVLTGQIARRAGEVIRGACEANDVKILAGHVSKDHVRLLVSVPPHLSASKLAQHVKGATSRKLLMEYKELNQQFWGKASLGEGLFRGEQRERHGRGHCGIHSEPRHGSGEGRQF